MRWRIVKTIFLKEIRETLRDRRTMIIMLFLPVVMCKIMSIGRQLPRLVVAVRQQSMLNAG